MTVTDTAHSLLADILQKHITITCDGRLLREGRLLLFARKDFYYKFIIEDNKKINKLFELPYPFDCRGNSSQIFFDYRIDTLAKNDVVLYYRLVLGGPKNKYLDRQVVINAL